MVECKAKALTAESKKGDLEAIQEDFEKGIKKGTKQAHTVIEGIETDSIEFLNEHKGLELNSEEIDTYIPIVIVRDHYDRLGTKEYTHLIENIHTTPYVADIYNFEILGDLFSPKGMKKYVLGREHILPERVKRYILERDLFSPEGMEKYVLERINMNEKGYVVGTDERDYIGTYLSGTYDRMKPLLEAGHDEQPFVQNILNDHSSAIPEFITEKHSIAPSDPVYFVNR